MIHSRKPPLSFELGVNHLHGVLRVDQIRADTLVQLVQHWREDESREAILAALDELSDVVHSVRREGELDAAVEQVEDVAAMETAQVEVSSPDMHRLAAEAEMALTVLDRFNPKRRTA
ncbi:hypothetical protein ABZX40_13200 [Streptomyces sp. NPDC004610]|uniref:hypothetical protein n=1 Tax=unclassified Streptomyces TaxID=2593676 RepID=UPI0033A2CFFA